MSVVPDGCDAFSMLSFGGGVESWAATDSTSKVCVTDLLFWNSVSWFYVCVHVTGALLLSKVG